MFHADKIPEQGVFMSIAEYAPYRKAGWKSRIESANQLADKYIARTAFCSYCYTDMGPLVGSESPDDRYWCGDCDKSGVEFWNKQRGK